MNRVAYAIIISVAVFASPSFAQEQSIRVLGVGTGGINTSQAAYRLSRITNVWNNSPLGTSITVEILNNGNLATLTTNPLLGTKLQQIIDVKLGAYAAALASVRSQYSADIVIVFSAGFLDSGCGRAGQGNWTHFDENGEPDGSPGSFNPNAQGLDLNGANTGHVAIVVTNSSGVCDDSYAATHEFGHLLGGGHERSAEMGTQIGWYLFSDSHAYARVTSSSRGPRALRSVITTPDPLECFYNGGPVECTVKPWFSGGNFSEPGSVNINAVNQTALSVANYIQTPVCTQVAQPQNLGGILGGSCDPSPWTRHVLYWSDFCPQATAFYELWGKQPISELFYSYKDTFPSLATIQNIYVVGSDALAKVRACDNSLQCSDLSEDWYYAYFIPCP